MSLRSDKASDKDLGLDDEGKLTLTNLANDRFACAVRLLVACSRARALRAPGSAAPLRARWMWEVHDGAISVPSDPLSRRSDFERKEEFDCT